MADRIRSYTVIAAGVLMLCAASAGAEEAMGQGAPPDDARRIEFIQNSLDGGQKKAALWWYSWMGIYAGSGLIQTGLMFLPENRDGERIVNATGAAKSFIGLASLFIPPFSPAYAGKTLRKLPAETPDERKSKLAAAESSLDRAADSEEFETSILQRLGGYVVNAAGFGVAWYYVVNQMHRDDLRPEIIIDAVIGLTAGELAILTVPTKAIGDREIYRKEFKGNASQDPGGHIFIGYYPGGLSVTWLF